MSTEAQQPAGISPWTLAAVAAGATLAVLVAPGWVPKLAASLSGAEPRAFWYVSRASGVTAYALLWLSVVAGLSMTGKVRARRVSPPLRYAVHRQAAWLGLLFAAFHAMVLLGDAYLRPTLAALLVPFGLEHARGWIGLGQLALYGGLVVAASERLRARIGFRGWRALHFASFTVYVMALAHGVLAGTDSASPWIAAWYVVSGGAVSLLTAHRLLGARRQPPSSARTNAA